MQGSAPKDARVSPYLNAQESPSVVEGDAPPTQAGEKVAMNSEEAVVQQLARDHAIALALSYDRPSRVLGGRSSEVKLFSHLQEKSF